MFGSVKASLAWPLLCLLAAPVWASPFAYIPNNTSSNVSVIDLDTNTVVNTITVGSDSYGVSASADGKTVYVTNRVGNTVSVIDTATNTVSATIAVGTNPYGASVSPDSKKVYVTNDLDNTISVIDAASKTVTATIIVGTNPTGLAVSPNGSHVYVANYGSNTVSVIDTATNSLSATIAVGMYPFGVSVSPDGNHVYVTNTSLRMVSNSTVSVIATATNAVVATIPVGDAPQGVSVSPDSSHVYVTSYNHGTVSVIGTATNAVTATITVGSSPVGVSVSADGKTVYVANDGSNSVSAINTATNTVSATIAVGTHPLAFGNFIAAVPTPALQPPTIALAFNPASIAAGGTTTLTATLTNPNAGSLQIDSAVTISGLPGGAAIDIASVSSSGSCGAPPIVIPANASCTLVYTAISGGNSAGSFTANWPAGVQYLDTTDNTTSVNSTSASTATLTVAAAAPLQAPMVALAFNPASIATGATTTLTATLTNPNSDGLQIDSAVTITGLPGGAAIDIASVSSSGSCGAPPIVIPANASCTLVYTAISGGNSAGSFTANWPAGVQYLDTTDNTTSVNSTSASTAALTVRSTTGPGTGDIAPAPTLSGWMMMVLGLMLAAIGVARRSLE